MKRSFVIFLSILLFLSVLVLGSAILSNNSSAQPSQNPPDHPGATEIHWALIHATYSTIQVWHESHPSITAQVGWTGSQRYYAVTFPREFKVLACTATVNGGCHRIHPIPGMYTQQLEENEVKIYIMDRGTCSVTQDTYYDIKFTIVAYSKRGTN